jgi:hypothetical protein
VSILPYGFVAPKVVYSPTLNIDRLVVRRTISLTPEDSFPLNGMPQVPDIGIKVQSMVDVNGVVFADRPGLEEINDDSYASFIADDAYFDSITGIWTPFRDNSSALYQLVGNPGQYPTMVSNEYRVAKELIVHDALRFDDQTLHTNFNQGLDDATNFTIALAIDPLDPGPHELLTFSDGSTISIVSSGLLGFMDNRHWSVKIPTGLSFKPMFVVLELKPPTVTLYAGFGPTLVHRGSSTVSRNVTKFDFVIGSPMYLYALDLWGDDAPSATTIIARYSTVLGSTDSAIGAFA